MRAWHDRLVVRCRRCVTNCLHDGSLQAGSWDHQEMSIHAMLN